MRQVSHAVEGCTKTIRRISADRTADNSVCGLFERIVAFDANPIGVQAVSSGSGAGGGAEKSRHAYGNADQLRRSIRFAALVPDRGQLRCSPGRSPGLRRGAAPVLRLERLVVLVEPRWLDIGQVDAPDGVEYQQCG